MVSRKSEGVVVEPLGCYFSRLCENYGKFDRIIKEQVAIHNQDKEKKIYYVDPDRLEALPDWCKGIGSFDAEHHKKSGVPTNAIISSTVKCMTLMELVRRYDFYDIDLLQVDVEGYDGEIIKMIDFDLIKPKIIKYEHAHLSQAEKAEISALLESRDYITWRQGNDIIASCI